KYTQTERTAGTPPGSINASSVEVVGHRDPARARNVGRLDTEGRIAGEDVLVSDVHGGDRLRRSRRGGGGEDGSSPRPRYPLYQDRGDAVDALGRWDHRQRRRAGARDGKDRGAVMMGIDILQDA